MTVLADLFAFTAIGLADTEEFVVDQAVAIVVFAIADFGFRLWSRTAAKLAVYARSFALAASPRARFVRDAVIDLAVTVVIFAVTDFGFGFSRGAKHPFSGATFFSTVATGGRTRLCQTVVDGAVAVVIYVVTSFGLGLFSGTSLPLAVLAKLDTAFATGFTTAGEAIVDLAVAIVVFAVAILGDGISCDGIASGCFFIGRTNELSRAFTFTRAALARLSEVREVFVDLAVTVIVDAIALFGFGVFDADTTQRTVAALLGTGSTNTGFAGGTRCATIGVSFVDLAVAVVVETVALFRAWVDRAHTSQRAVLASLRPCGTNAFFACIASAPATRIVFVDLAIAIVVKTIALFGARCGRSDTIQLTALALKCTCATNARLTGRTSTTAARVVFVDGAVAVIVDAVADLRRRYTGLNATHGPCACRVADVLAAVSASTLSSVTGLAHIKSVVDGSVTIIVDAVALFGGGVGGSDASQGTVLALANTCATNAGLTSRTSATAARVVFVDGSVAVVIEAVAGLGSRLAGLNATKRAVLALLCSRTTDPLKSCGTSATATRVVFVDASVAVVIKAVAGLGSRCGGADALEATAARALSGSCATNTGLTGGTSDACSSDAVVNLTVTVVVKTIAHFLGGVVDDGVRRIL